MSTPFKDRKPPSDAEIREYFLILKEDGRSRVFAPLAEALVRRGRLTEAEQICHYGIDHNPDFSDGHLALARVLFYRFRYQEAIQEVKLTLALDSQSVEAYLIAAEIFLARSQHKAASDACLKALDMDPDNGEAIRLLERVGQAPPQQPAAQPGQQEPGRFKATAGTAPSRRQLEPEAPPAMTNPFQQLMQELEGEAAERLDEDQPFTALSSGSQADIPALADGAGPAGLGPDFEVPTAPVQRPASIPSLPARPPTGNPVPASQQAPGPPAAAGGPELGRSTLPPTPPPAPSASGLVDDLLAQVPGANPRADPRADPLAPPREAGPVEHPPDVPAAPPASRPAPAAPTTSAWRRVDAAQAVIDAYRDRIPASDLGDLPLKVPRLGALLPLLGVLALLAAAVALILVLVPTDPPPEPKVPGLEPSRDTPDVAPSTPGPTRAPRAEAMSPGEAAPIVAQPLPDDGPAEGQSPGGQRDDGEPAPVALSPDPATGPGDAKPAAKPVSKPKKPKKRRTRKRRRAPRRRRAPK